jgi:polysaccharide pyruvyl transferase WcaK-like protein
MRIHHFYPRTNNIGDHFVQRGIETMVRRLRPEASIDLFDINDRGRDKTDFGLTHQAVERANRGADLIIVGGSNLYEGNYRWHWGVHLEKDALARLRVPLVLLGIGSGSGFGAPLHAASRRAISEIRLLNDYAKLSGARDVLTLAWLHQIGITKAQLTGDPATFVFNRPLQEMKATGKILIVMPPRRFWSSIHQFWDVHTHGRAMFKALVLLAKGLRKSVNEVIVACNDPLDLPLARSLFNSVVPDVVCPATPEEYFELVSGCSVVVSGRLHSAVIAFSLGVPFILLNVDQRTEGFIRTYHLEDWSINVTRTDVQTALNRLMAKVLSAETRPAWSRLIFLREDMKARASKAIADVLQ